MTVSAIEIDAALAQIDTGRWHAAAVKLKLIALVKVNTVHAPGTGPAELSARHVREFTGNGDYWALAVLDELVGLDGVLWRVDAAGSRPHAYDFNDVDQWRVPWGSPFELVEYRLARLTGRLRDANPEVVPRARAAQTRFAPRTRAAQDPTCAAHPRGTNGDPVPRTRAAQTRGDAGPLPTSSSSFSSTGATAGDQEEEQHERDHEPTGELRLRRAIFARTGQATFGEPLRRLQTLAAGGADIDELTRVVRDYPQAGAGPPVLVEALELAATQYTTPAEPPRSLKHELGTRARLEAERLTVAEAAPMPAGFRAGLRLSPPGDGCENVTHPEGVST